MRDFTQCTYCVHYIRKTICGKGHSTAKEIFEGGKRVGIRIGPSGKCKDRKEDLIDFD